MFVVRMFWACLLVALLLAACTKKPVEHRGKVYCPDCGAEVDVLFEKRY